MSNGKKSVLFKIMAGILALLMIASVCFTLIAFLVQSK